MSCSSDGGDARAWAFIEVAASAGGHERFGVAIDANIVTASIKALIVATARIRAKYPAITASQVA